MKRDRTERRLAVATLAAVVKRVMRDCVIVNLGEEPKGLDESCLTRRRSDDDEYHKSSSSIIHVPVPYPVPYIALSPPLSPPPPSRQRSQS